jgi:hypothetical protein
VLAKPLDNPFKMIHNTGEQEQKTKDKEHEHKIVFYNFIITGRYHVARVYTRKPPRVFDKPL